MSEATSLHSVNPQMSFALGTSVDGAPAGQTRRMQTDKDKEDVKQAQKDFQRTLNYEEIARTHWLNDTKFAEGDAYNGYQWPNVVRSRRDVDARPTLTINRTRQHNLQIINDAKQNKPGIAIRPVGNQATKEAADAIEGLIRHIEYQSNATVAYDMATTHQVRGGYGVIRVETGWAGDDTLDQEIYIRPVPDPLSVLFDPAARMPDKSDARFAFVFDQINRDEFAEIYPQYKDHIPHSALNAGDSDWVTDESIRICEYFRAVPKTDFVVRYTDPDSGIMVTSFMSKMPQELVQQVIGDPRTRQRETVWTEIEWMLIVGNEIAERAIWPGRYIPLVPVIGEETVIDGQLDRKGHTRSLLDPQRMYNYWASAAVEFGALQTKAPWIAPAAAIETHEVYWNNANKNNYSVLPYNHIDDEGNELPPPQRPGMPEQAPLYLSGMEISQNEMMIVSGQYQSQMGAPSNERSGKAINERQRQGDTATYHFIDNLGIAIRQVGKIILGLIPVVYTEKRWVHILANDGKPFQTLIDPSAQQAWSQQLDKDNNTVHQVLNPSLGKYDVEADIGPAYATRRQEAFQAFTTILTQAPELTSIIGDILMKNGDFPGADEAAERLERMLPPQATGKGPSQNEQQLQQQVQALQQALSKTFDQLVAERLKLKGKDMQKEIDVYAAETNRVKALGDLLQMEPAGVHALVQQVIMQSLKTDLSPVVKSATSDMLHPPEGNASQFADANSMGLAGQSSHPAMPPQNPAASPPGGGLPGGT